MVQRTIDKGKHDMQNQRIILDNKQRVIYIASWTNNSYFYIGQTQCFRNRKYTHSCTLKNNRHKNPKLQNVFNKYGEPQFHIIEECEIEELDQREQFYLDLLFNDPNCLNIAKYAEATRRGIKHTEEAKQKMSEAKKGHTFNKGRTFTEEHRQNLSKALKGKINGTPSDETRARISEGRKGKNLGPLTEEHKQKISKSSLGKVISEETRKKMSEAAKRREALRREKTNDE